VDADVGSFLRVFSVLRAIRPAGGTSLGSGGVGGGGRFGLERLLVLLVVDQVFVVMRGHVCLSLLLRGGVARKDVSLLVGRRE
jgi:hypothetical protein